MPRRPKGEGEATQKTPRVRKKKESASICGTPSIDMKLEPVNSLGFEQIGGSLGGNIQQQGPPHNVMQHNGGLNTSNMFSPDEMTGQAPPPGQAGVSGIHFSAAHPDYFFHHGAPGAPVPPQIPLPPSHPNMPLYGGPMMPQHPHQQSHLPMPQIQPQQFNDAEQQMPVPPFLYQPPMGGPHNAPPPGGGPPLPNPQTGGAPPHLMLRQFAMNSFGPNFPQQPYLEYRLSEMNRRLYSFHTSQPNLPPQDHAQWWEAFSHEFFDDDARMTISLLDSSDMTNRKYTIGRSLIPRFHRTIFDNGVTEMLYVPRSPAQERINPQQWGMCALDCDNVLMVTRHDRPIPAEVHNECRLFLEFSPFEESIGYRIRHWAIEIRYTREYYSSPKDLGMENIQQEIVKNKITRSGLPPAALHYLKLCLILEPMQILMQHSKANNNAHPRTSLNYILFNHHNRLNSVAQQQHQIQPLLNPGLSLNQPSMSVPQTPIQEEAATGKKPPRKRQRKNVANAGGTASSPKKKNATASAVATPPPQPQPQAAQIPPNVALSQPQQQHPGSFPPNHPAIFNPNHLMYQDVMVVGEPSMMGCEFGEDDERAISRIENTQYVDPNSSVACSSGGATSTSLGQQGIL